MTKEELEKRVAELESKRKRINKQMYNAVMEYISSLPYKEGDKICTDHRSAAWIAYIVPGREIRDNYTGDITVMVSSAKCDDTRLIRCTPLWREEIDTIKKID